MTTTQDPSIFGQLHASWYDRWHHTKAYQSEVDQLRTVFATEGPVDSVLDFGCGTGRHLELLAEAGHDVTGVDRSPGMVEVASNRLARFGSRARVVQSEVAELHLDRAFDAVTMMFSVLGYHVSDEALFTTFAAAHRHLRPGGLLVFDNLEGSAVLRDGVRGGFTVVEDGDIQFLRDSRGRVRRTEQIYDFAIRMWMFQQDRLIDYAEETHEIRYFLPRELQLILETAGFTLLGSEPLAGDLPGPTVDWSRLFWARRSE